MPNLGHATTTTQAPISGKIPKMRFLECLVYYIVSLIWKISVTESDRSLHHFLAGDFTVSIPRKYSSPKHTKWLHKALHLIFPHPISFHPMSHSQPSPLQANHSAFQNVTNPLRMEHLLQLLRPKIRNPIRRRNKSSRTPTPTPPPTHNPPPPLSTTTPRVRES